MKNYQTLQSYNSVNKKVALIQYDGRKAILKLANDSEQTKSEVAMMRLISNTGYAPRVLFVADNYFICEYIDGKSFLQAYVESTMLDDDIALSVLAQKLAIFIQMVHSVSDNKVFKHIDFANFVISDDRCVGVSYDSLVDGMPYYDVAQVIAFAITHASGEYFSSFPFIGKFLECFHLKVIDIVNDLSDAMTKYDPHNLLDKQAVMDALISFEERGTAWKIIGNK